MISATAHRATVHQGLPAMAALRAALASEPLLGFDTASWREDKADGAKPAFVGFIGNPITVTNTNDTGAGSLRAAIAQANTDGGNGLFDSISFDPSLAGQTITLNSTLTITQGVLISGTDSQNNPLNITISGNNSVGVFTVNTSSNATQTSIDNLTIANGHSTGAAGTNGNVGPNVTNIDGGSGGDAAGGIYLQSGLLNLSSDTFINNTATGGQGGTGGFTGQMAQTKGVGGSGGNAAGAVYVTQGAAVQASNLIFTNNTATAGAGGSSQSGFQAASGTADPNSNSQAVRAAAVTCYATGTAIRVVRDAVAADVAIEDLRVGDLALTASGAQRPIRWIGSRRTDCLHHPRPEDALPVRIRAGAFGEGKPVRDLVVSPGHSIALDVLGEVLIPAAALVNGSTVVQEDVDAVTYWHIELDEHDLLLAEGQAAESYLDMGNRAFFAHTRGGDGSEGAAVIDFAASPDTDPSLRTHADFCRPFHPDGPLVAFVRERMDAQAAARGWRLSGAEPWERVHVLADGVRVEPEVRGLAARFSIPDGASDLWLVSPTAAPYELGMSTDGRRLGLMVSELRVGAGWDARAVGLGDPLLCAGFHAVEGEAGVPRRWTAGRARLPAALWTGAGLDRDRTLVLRLDEAMPALPRWVEPEKRDDAAADRLAA